MTYNRYHSVCGEDQKIREMGILPLTGVFVDVGAGPPFDGNNTGHYERNNWTGLCVDAHPRVIENLKRERAPSTIIEHCAVGTEEGTVKFFINGDMNLSSKLPGRPCIGEIEVPAARLETLLVRHGIGKIDLLSIDAEGCDLDVWKSMDWAKHRPTAVIIEPGDDRWEIQREMQSKGYELAHVTADNLIFKLNLEWQLIGYEYEDWIFGPKIRGIVRPTLGEIYFTEDLDDPRGGWVWYTLCQDQPIRGLAGNRAQAVWEVETALGENR